MRIFIVIAVLFLIAVDHGCAAPAPGHHNKNGENMPIFEDKDASFAVIPSDRVKRSILDSETIQFTPFEDMMEESRINKRSPDEKQGGRSFYNGQPIGVSQLCNGCGLINPYAGGTYSGK